jgi:hypothetical protein
MKTTAFFVVAAMLGGPLGAQERKPVPKDSVRVFVPGCSKGMIFTAGARTEDSPGAPVPEGMHLRMSGPKEVIAEIKAHEGSRIEITGLMKKGQPGEGVSIGGGVRVSPGPSGPSGGMRPSPGGSQNMIDVEGWRSVQGVCPSR